MKYEKWFVEISNLASNTICWLESIPMSSKSAIIFDIDDTLVDRSGNRIDPIYSVYQKALQLNLVVVLITSRQANPESIEYTLNQLNRLGIVGHSDLYMMQPHVSDPYMFKTISRKDVWSKGYVVIASIGDMPWDVGEYGGYSIRLPPCPKFDHNNLKTRMSEVINNIS